LVDFEYSGYGERYYDIANLAVMNEFNDDEIDRALELYFAKELEVVSCIARLTSDLFHFVLWYE
jgi:thiamine kinase-like enzyme